MKLKLLFFMGILSVLCNTVSGQSNTAPFFRSNPQDRVVCPGYTAANVRYQTDDDNTFAEDLIVTATYTNLVGSQAVTFINTFEAGGINRTITVIPTGPIFTESVVEVTITISDVGNPLPNLTATTTFTVTFEDTGAPVITQITPLVDSDVSLDTACSYTMTDYRSSLTVIDDCGGAVSITQTPDVGSLVAGGDGTQQLVVLTASDDYGNSSSISFTITLQDDTPPTVLVNDPITVELDGSGIATITPEDVDDGSTDNCSISASLTLSIDISSFDCSNIGNNDVILTVTDVAGNSASQTVNVIVVDNISPTITCSSDVSVSNDSGECGALLTLTLPMSGDNCGVTASSATRSDSLLLTDEYPVGTTTVKWIVEDSSGNSASCTQTITVNDTEDPNAIAQNTTVYLDASGDASITPTDIDNGSNDNCDTAVSLSLDVTSFDCSNLGPNSVILTVEDNFGNTDTANATVTVVDNIFPTISGIDDVTQDNDTSVCGANLTFSPTAADNCSAGLGSPSGVRSDAPLGLGDTFPVGTTTILWSVSDGSGNTATATQTVTINDVDPPVFDPLYDFAALLTVQNDFDTCGYLASQLTKPNVIDNCTPFSGDVTVTPAFIPVSAGPDHIPTTITWTATDAYGNTVSATQLVLVEDLELPVMRTINRTLYFDANGQIVILPGDIDDGSTDNSGTDCFTKYVVDNILDCNEKGDNTVNLHGQDLYGNQHYQVATVRALDNTPPTFVDAVLPDLAFNTNSGCEWVDALPIPATKDNCSVKSVSYTASGPFVPGSTVVVTWTVTDTAETTLVGDIDGVLAGVHPANTTTMTQNVTVTDAEKPVAIAQVGVVVELDSNGNATILPIEIDNGSTDNCGIASYSLDKVSFNCLNVGANTVTLTVIDIHGNVNFATATVTVSEPIIPIARTRNITVQLNAAGTVSILPSDINNGSTDNCSIASYTLSQSTFNCSNVGQNIITLTAIDTSNNSSVPVNATVTVQDVTAPVVITQRYTAQLDVNGLATVTPANVNNGSTDACGIATYAISKSNFTCANVGENIVTLTVTDVNGNSAQGFATVNVVDSVKPEVEAKDIELVLDGISVSITPEDVFVSATDACGVDVHSYTLSRDTFTIVDVLNSPITVTLSVTDVNGNVGTDDFLITFPTLPTVANEVITPNGDGTNDTWVIDNITNHPKSIVRVYNAWGSLVFSAVNYQNNWDGKLNGNDVTLPDGGSYYYQIDLEGNGTINNQGWLYITRQ